MRRSRLFLPTALCLSAAALLATGSVNAEEAPAVAVGARVRVSIGSRTLVGRLQALDDETLVLRMKGEGGPAIVAVDTISRIDVSRSSKGRGAGRGALIGLLGGAVIGFAAGQECHSTESLCFNRGATALGGALLGAPIGALIGLAFPAQAWHEVHLKDVHVRAASVRGRGVGLSVSAGF